MTGREIARLSKGGALRSIRTTGHIYENSDTQWRLWTRLDRTGIRRVKSIVHILLSEGWTELK